MSFLGTFTGGRLFAPIDHKTKLTEQHHEEKCNPAKIMALAKDNQQAVAVRNNPLIMDDCQVPSYQDLLGIFHNAQNAMMDFPESVRRDFKNPEQMLKFLNEPQNREIAEKNGLLKKRPKQPEPGHAEVSHPVIKKGKKVTPPKGGEDPSDEDGGAQHD